MSTPDLYLRTSFVLDSEGRIVSTREPNATSGPLFTVVRSLKSCAWAVRADVPRDLASELERLAQDEPPAIDLRQAPVNADRYIILLRDLLGTDELPEIKTSQSDGPAFEFPDLLPAVADVVVVEDESPLEHNFQGWKPGEIAAGCAPVLAIVADDHPVSICFCARRSDEAAEAGVETAAEYRGRGLAPRVTTAWARAVHDSGLTPLYSTAWTNRASLAVAKKLQLMIYASYWSLAAGG